jgi:hypothetical protein
MAQTADGALPSGIVTPHRNVGDNRMGMDVVLAALEARGYPPQLRRGTVATYAVPCPAHPDKGLILHRIADPSSVEIVGHPGCEIHEALDGVLGGTVDPPKGKAKSQADVLAAMADARWLFRRTGTGAVYALPKDGPHIARPLRGGSRSFRAELAAAFYDRHGKVASASALAAAVETVEGLAGEAEPITLHTRVAEAHGALWLDLGDETGQAVKITPGGWSVEAVPPVWFRRTELTAPLPEPVRGGSLDELWPLVNITPDDRPLILAAQVATLWPDIPHPPTFVQARPGAAKTTSARTLAGLLDPSTAQVSGQPTSIEEWVTAAAGSHVVAIDNVSALPEWFSDALCRASTGEGMKRRKLYTDADLSVITFRRMVYLTGVHILGVKDDLADRALSIELDKPARRLTETEMAATWGQAHPRILGALLDLAARTMAELPKVTSEGLPRMADFYRILLAVDAALGNGGAGAKRYAEMVEDMAAELANDDPLLLALGQDIRQAWEGTSTELLAKLDTRWAEGLLRRPKGWPDSPKALTQRLTEAIPTLEQLGWSVVKQARTGKAKVCRWLLTPPPATTESRRA